MIPFLPAFISCYFSIPIQHFYLSLSLFDSQQIYETIQDKHCPCQHLATTLYRQQEPQCTCYYEHSEQKYPTTTHENEIKFKY
ncbi:unnamed protein product [Rotaria sp. Silwood2]|nr:unnamed protein product [Rotaria sp. Silwood2]CAF3153896.1 unnamed protein product [Rotaria sp. Silwood2]